MRVDLLVGAGNVSVGIVGAADGDCIPMVASDVTLDVFWVEGAVEELVGRLLEERRWRRVGHALRTHFIVV